MTSAKHDGGAGALVTTFSTDDFAPEHRFEAWRDIMKASHDVVAPPAAFSARLRTAHLGSMLLHEVTTSGQGVERAARRIGSDGLEHIVLQMNTVPMQGGAGDRTIRVPAGSVVVSALSQPLRRQPARDVDAVVISLSRSSILEVLPDPELVHGAVLTDGMGAILRDHMLALAREVRRLPRDAAPELARSTALMLAAAVRSNCRDIGDARLALERVALFRARRFIDANMRVPSLTPEMVAAAAGVSQRTLYRLFAPSGGVAAFIRARRLRAARSALVGASGRARIAEVAHAHGFDDAAHFSRSMRKAFGMSPRELIGEMSGLHRVEAGATPDDYMNWVRSLG